MTPSTSINFILLLSHLLANFLVSGSNVTDAEAWFSKTPQDVFFDLGETLKFDCECNSLKFWPEVTIVHNGILIPEADSNKDKRIHIGDYKKFQNRITKIYTWTQQLIIESALRGDEGTIECICSNFDTGEVIISHTANITTHNEVEVTVFSKQEQITNPLLTTADDVIKVQVTSHASSRDSSGNITLVCNAYLHDDCDVIAWVDKTRRREIKRSKASENTLISTLWVGLDNIKLVYGKYQCQCNFSNGDSKISSTVLIGRPPVVPELREANFVISGETRKSVLYLDDVSEDTYGYPPANPLLWSRWVQLRNGSSVRRSLDFAGPQGSRFIYEASKLVIQNTEYGDAGMYECLVKNEFGNFSFSVSLKVIDKYAAVWPFFGLSIAVIFLMVAIIFFERHTKKDV